MLFFSLVPTQGPTCSPSPGRLVEVSTSCVLHAHIEVSHLFAYNIVF